MTAEPLSLGQPAKAYTLLADVYPALAAEWHPTKNYGQPADGQAVNTESRAMYWWQCPVHGAFRMTMRTRIVKGAGCKSCRLEAKADLDAATGRRPGANQNRSPGPAPAHPKPGNSLAEKYPALAAEWHPTLNAGLTPAQVSSGSGYEAWWICETHGAFRSRIRRRYREGAGCIKCAHARRRGTRPPAIRSTTPLSELHPKLAAQWHPTLNGDLTPDLVTSSDCEPHWWDCPDHGAWKAQIQSRRAGRSNCPKCARRVATERLKAPAAGLSLGDLFPELVPEWDIAANNGLTAFDVRYGSTAPRWWRCAEHGPFSTSSIRRIRKNGFCPACKAKGTFKPVPFKKTSDMGVTTVPFYLAERHPELAAKWHPTLNGDVEFSLIPLWDERRQRTGRWWWQCDTHGPYQRKVSINTVPDMAPCPKCSPTHKNRGLPVSFDMSLAGKQPAVAAEWHPTLNGDVTPAMVTVASHTRRWWQCDIHGAFEMAPASRTRSAKPGRCPKCTKAKSATRAPHRTQ